MNFVINDDSDDSELKLPELNDSLAKYVQRHERQQNARSGKLFNVAPDINSVSDFYYNILYDNKNDI